MNTKKLLNLGSNGKLSVVVGFVFISVLGFLDYATGYEYAFSVFYILPISLVTWYSTPKIGVAACVVSAIVWFWADKSAGHPYSNIFIPYWNSLIRFSFFVVITYLLTALKDALQREKSLSLTDYLTGASNSRHFYDIVQMEINRLERTRSPFTIAYFDVDNFKSINDTLGHAEGDLVLKSIVNSLKSKMRKTDSIARLGGDELALFFPDTHREAAQLILPKLQDVLTNEMARMNWMVTFSMGVVTYTIAPPTVDELIKMADDLMYSAKQQGKNMVKYSVYGADSLSKQNTG